MVAALLHLDEGARAILEANRCVGGKMLYRLGRRRDIADLHAFPGSRAPGRRLHLLDVADHLVDFGHGGEAAWIDLRRAAGDDDARAGTLAAQAADRLPRLALGFGGHRAGVDDHRVARARRCAHAP